MKRLQTVKAGILAAAVVGVVGMANSAQAADTLVWNNTNVGTSSPAQWDGSALNFNDSTTSTNGVAYTDGSNVQFSDGLRNGSTIVLAVGNASGNGVAPGSVEFTHTSGGTTSYNLYTNTSNTVGINGSTTLTLDSGFGGTVFVNQANTFTGGIFINGGTLRSAPGNLPSTTTITLNGGTFASPTSTQNYTATQNFVVTSGSTSTISLGGAGSFAGTITSSSGATPANTTLYIGIGGTNTITGINFANSTGASPSSSFAGTVSLGASTGYMRIAAGSPNAVFDLGTSTASLVIQTAGTPVYLGGLSGGSGTFLTGPSGGTQNNTAYIIGGAGQNTMFGGLVALGSKGRTLLQIVGGSLSMTNGSQTFSTNSSNTGAATTVTGGALYLNNTSGSAAGPSGIYINGGTLGGNGFTNGATAASGNSIVTVNQVAATSFATGGHIAPGSAGSTAGSTAGTLTITNGLVLNDYSNLDFTLNSASTSTGNDQISTYALTAPASGLVKVNFAFTGAAPLTDVAYDLVNYTTLNGSPTSWTAANLPTGYTATFAATGSQVTVTFAVPEPASLAILGLGFLGLRRRRAR